jgi:hypothetical protein
MEHLVSMKSETEKAIRNILTLSVPFDEMRLLLGYSSNI